MLIIVTYNNNNNYYYYYYYNTNICYNFTTITINNILLIIRNINTYKK